jgi:hypothetical protein
MGNRNHRIEVPSGDWPKRENQRHQRPTGRHRVGEQRDSRIASRQALSHDARTHHRHQQEGRAQSLTSNTPDHSRPPSRQPASPHE